ncbi:MAG: hypothetical protein P8K77_00445 [Polaribacter sp.]|nr:hypothetical protein [Polaribacter sp.]
MLPKNAKPLIRILQKHHKLHILLIGFVFFFHTEVIAQVHPTEKFEFLQNRYNGPIETITKDFTKKQLNTLKDKLAREGIVFNFSNLKYNTNNKIVKITLTLKNKKSTYTATWSDKNKPIPNIKTGESYGVVFAIASKFFDPKTLIGN